MFWTIYGVEKLQCDYSTKTTNIKMRCEIQVLVFSFWVKIKKNGCLDIEIQALTKHGYFRKDLSFCILISTNIRRAGCCAGCLEISDFCDLNFRICLNEYWLKRQMFENLGFLKSEFWYLTTGKYWNDGVWKSTDEYRKLGCLRFFITQAFVFDYRQISTRRIFDFTCTDAIPHTTE